ncbi:GIY-YIG nuclease family protein [Halospeciosus flavus]|uniref:DUF123 domain-containing protein n=1 Tax=Halospeciosus flavus TaxID=3032283 RepID=A0ABD5Z4U2_9EURY|nr:GIY-YIG nuclease family protein [Halospeciosus flavus]
MPPGTYTLLVELAEPATIEFGARGEHDLDAGWYAYTGSAFGPGGLSRVERHRDVAAGRNDARHWHVDYLLGHPDTRLAEAVTSEHADAECTVARRIRAATGVDGVGALGASDCDCETHLASASKRERLAAAVRAAHVANADADGSDGQDDSSV